MRFWYSVTSQTKLNNAFPLDRTKHGLRLMLLVSEDIPYDFLLDTKPSGNIKHVFANLT